MVLLTNMRITNHLDRVAYYIEKSCHLSYFEYQWFLANQTLNQQRLVAVIHMETPFCTNYSTLVAIVIRLIPLVKYLQFHDHLTNPKMNTSKFEREHVFFFCLSLLPVNKSVFILRSCFYCFTTPGISCDSDCEPVLVLKITCRYNSLTIGGFF